MAAAEPSERLHDRESAPWQRIAFATRAGTSTPQNIAFTPSPSDSGSLGEPGTSQNCLGAPPLPPPAVSDPGKSVVNVSSEAELQAAVANLTDSTLILIEPGHYHLSNTLWVNSSDITLRGNTDSCDDVVLLGPGMENSNGANSVPHGIWTASDNLKVQNLTIRDVYFHPLIINGGGNQPQFYNLQLLDAGQQFIKVNPNGFGDGSDYGRVEFTTMRYTNGPPTSDHGAGVGYTNGVDVHGGQGWIIRNNLFANFHTPDTAHYLWNPAILMWNGARDTLVENNRFIDVDRAIAFGLLDRANDHTGGIIRNNMIVLRPELFSNTRRTGSDAQIIVWNSPGTAVVHNTILTQGNMNKAIELRFDSSGSEVHNNLVDAPITHRDGAGFGNSANVSITDTSLFANPGVADLHLVRNASGITDAVMCRKDAISDFDGDSRPSGLVDAGADERS